MARNNEVGGVRETKRVLGLGDIHTVSEVRGAAECIALTCRMSTCTHTQGKQDRDTEEGSNMGSMAGGTREVMPSLRWYPTVASTQRERALTCQAIAEIAQ